MVDGRNLLASLYLESLSVLPTDVDEGSLGDDVAASPTATSAAVAPTTILSARRAAHVEVAPKAPSETADPAAAQGSSKRFDVDTARQRVRAVRRTSNTLGSGGSANPSLLLRRVLRVDLLEVAGDRPATFRNVGFLSVGAGSSGSGSC